MQIRCDTPLLGSILLLLVFTGSAGTAFGADPAGIHPAWEEKSVVLVVRQTPTFMLATGGGTAAAALGFFGPAHDSGHSMVDAGARLIADDQIEDPAIRITTGLVDGLQSTYGLTLVPNDGAPNPDKSDMSAVRQRYPSADLLLEFRTVEWRTFYFLDLSHYDVWYHAKARLIDLNTGSTLLSGACARRPTRTPDSPTFDQLLADHGARIRSAFESTAQNCLADLKRAFRL